MIPAIFGLFIKLASTQILLLLLIHNLGRMQGGFSGLQVTPLSNS